MPTTSSSSSRSSGSSGAVRPRLTHISRLNATSRKRSSRSRSATRRRSCSSASCSRVCRCSAPRLHATSATPARRAIRSISVASRFGRPATTPAVVSAVFMMFPCRSLDPPTAGRRTIPPLGGCAVIGDRYRDLGRRYRDQAENTPRSCAALTASCRDCTPSLARIAATWLSTVRTDTTSRSAISAFVSPSASNRSTPT